jgi:predicted CXXCH cytochrome family protein
MRKIMKESGHLVRLALVLVTGLLIFLAIRAAVVPATFGRLGHYRAAALDDIRARPFSFAGKAVCEGCHEEVAKVKSEGKHAGIACEACHGPSASHTEDPITNHAVKPDPAKLCVRCHEANPARPKAFPQVVSKEHANGMSCGDCHKPHTPKI